MGRFDWGHFACPQTLSTKMHRRPGPRGQCGGLSRCNDLFGEMSLQSFNIAAIVEWLMGHASFFTC